MKISVIIPVKNGEPALENCLRSIREQNSIDIEILILDSMSSDRSREISNSFGARVISIPDGTFNHGLTRNIGARYAKNEFLYYTVQDAWLPEKNMLERMVKHFEDQSVQAVAGHQATPWGHPDKNPVLWFKRFTEPMVTTREYPNLSFDQLTLKQQFEASGWDDVNAMYRKSALIQIPFRETDFSEDWLWANDALRNGMKILYDPSLIVYHYHHMYFGYVFKAKFIMNYYFHKFFKQLPAVPWSPVGAIKSTYTLLKLKEASILKKPYWILHNLMFNLSFFLSVIIFRTTFYLGGQRMLDKAYTIICKKVPQGKPKS